MSTFEVPYDEQGFYDGSHTNLPWTFWKDQNITDDDAFELMRVWNADEYLLSITFEPNQDNESYDYVYWSAHRNAWMYLQVSENMGIDNLVPFSPIDKVGDLLTLVITSLTWNDGRPRLYEVTLGKEAKQ